MSRINIVATDETERLTFSKLGSTFTGYAQVWYVTTKGENPIELGAVSVGYFDEGREVDEATFGGNILSITAYQLRDIADFCVALTDCYRRERASMAKQS